MASLDPSVFLRIAQVTGMSPAELAAYAMQNPEGFAQLMAQYNIAPPSAERLVPHVNDTIPIPGERDASGALRGPPMPVPQPQSTLGQDAGRAISRPVPVPLNMSGYVNASPRPDIVPERNWAAGMDQYVNASPRPQDAQASVGNALTAALSGIRAPEEPYVPALSAPAAPRPSGTVDTGNLEQILQQLLTMRRSTPTTLANAVR